MKVVSMKLYGPPRIIIMFNIYGMVLGHGIRLNRMITTTHTVMIGIETNILVFIWLMLFMVHIHGE